MLDLANAEWNTINQSHGWVARIQHAIQQVVPAVHDVREQWNLLAAYELCTGTLLKVPDLVFMRGELGRDKPEIWVKRLDQYRVACMKLLSGKRQKVENSEGGGGSPGAQAGSAEIVDSSGGTPEKQVMGAGGNEGAGATPPQDMTGKTDAPMDEDGAIAGTPTTTLLAGGTVRTEQGQSATGQETKGGPKVGTQDVKDCGNHGKKQCRRGADGCDRTGDLGCHHGARQGWPVTPEGRSQKQEAAGAGTGPSTPEAHPKMRGTRLLYFLQCPKVVADHPSPHGQPATRHDLGRQTSSALRGGPTMETGRGQGSSFTSLKTRTTSKPRSSLLAICHKSATPTQELGSRHGPRGATRVPVVT